MTSFRAREPDRRRRGEERPFRSKQGTATNQKPLDRKTPTQVRQNPIISADLRRAIRSVGAGTIFQAQRNTPFVWFVAQPAGGQRRGTNGSRSTVIDGSALWMAADKVIAKGERITARLPAVSDPLVFVPGTGALYSNFGIDILSAALAHAAGKPYDAVLKERVLDPLGLNDTMLLLPNPVPPNTVTRLQDMSRKYPATPTKRTISSTPVSGSISTSQTWQPLG